MSQLVNNEAILLTLAPGWQWTELWVSSLDSAEKGRLHWGNVSDVATLLSLSSFSFDFGDFGSADQGDVLSLSQATGFDRNARYALFVPDGLPSHNGLPGDNNDYLVYGATATETVVPEPGTLTLLGAGLASLCLARRRRASAA